MTTRRPVLHALLDRARRLARTQRAALEQTGERPEEARRLVADALVQAGMELREPSERHPS